MSKENNLSDFLADLSDGICTAEGISINTKINPQDFRTRIENLAITTPGEYEASVDLTAGAGLVSVSSGNMSLTESNEAPAAGFYLTAIGSGEVAATGTAAITQAGYLSTGEKEVSGSKSSNTATKYYSVPSSSLSVSGGDPGNTIGFFDSPRIKITLYDQTTSGATITDTKPSNGYYLTIGSGFGSFEVGLTTTINAITVNRTAGYSSEESINVQDEQTQSSTITIDRVTETSYITIPSGSLSVDGPTVTASAGYYGSDTSESVTTVERAPTTMMGAITDSGDDEYLSVFALNSQNTGYVIGSDETNSADITLSIDGPTVTMRESVNGQEVSKTIPSGSCTVSGGELSVVESFSYTPQISEFTFDRAPEGATISTNTPTTREYFKIVVGTAQYAGNTTVSRSAITDTHTAGYISDQSETTVISSETISPNVSISSASEIYYVSIPDNFYRAASEIRVYDYTGATLLGSYTFDTPAVVSNINYQCPVSPPFHGFTINGIYSFTANYGSGYGSGGYCLSIGGDIILSKGYGVSNNYSQSISPDDDGIIRLYENK